MFDIRDVSSVYWLEVCVTVRRHHSFYIIVENILVMVHKGLIIVLIFGKNSFVNVCVS